MADELQIIPQPDSVPSAVSTGYTRQNTKTSGIQNGIDHTAPVGASVSSVTLPIGGPVDVNGVLFSITAAATLTGISADTDYYIYLAAGSTSDKKTPTLTTDPGTFDASKNGRYTAGGDRILNWKLRGDGVGNVVCTRITDPQKTDVQPLGKADSPVFDDLSVGGDLTVGGAILPTSSPTFGSQSVGVNGQYILPRGMYFFRRTGNDSAADWQDIRANFSSGWDDEILVQGTYYVGSGVINYNFIGGFVISDGASVAIENTSSTSRTFYYQKY